MANINISNETVILSKSAEDIESILSGYSDLTNSVLTEVLNRETADNELSLRISNINGVEYIQVDELPSEPLKDHFDAFYIVANGRKEDNNLFTEYYWKDGKWETFGSASLDLSSYVKKSEIDSEPTDDSTNPVTSGGVKSALDGKADKQNGNGGFAAGHYASSGTGGAVGLSATTIAGGGAIGDGAHAIGDGGAVGKGTYTGDGFAGGKNAQTRFEDTEINAIQLGEGTNEKHFTAQIYDYQLLADYATTKSATDGKKYLKDVGVLSSLSTASKEDIVSAINEIMNDALPSKANKETEAGGFEAGHGASINGYGGAIGQYTSAVDGGAIGQGAKTIYGGATGCFAISKNGGAIGSGAVTGDGFAGGLGAKTYIPTADGEYTYLDAIQLGTGNNQNEFSMQIYDYQLLADYATTKSATDGKKYLKDVGKLSSLQTNNKISIIDAINELKSQIDSLSTQLSELKTTSSSTK